MTSCRTTRRTIRFCWIGKCLKGRDEVRKFMLQWRDLHLDAIGIHPSQVVLEEGLMAMRWTTFLKRGKCQYFVTGTYILYLDNAGKVTEALDFPDSPRWSSRRR
eukprot:Sspe_Gene.34445::Locus_16745_Transcript_1_1_Confidence_1.000_Length_731::g.34445::m.34445